MRRCWKMQRRGIGSGDLDRPSPDIGQILKRCVAASLKLTWDTLRSIWFRRSSAERTEAFVRRRRVIRTTAAMDLKERTVAGHSLHLNEDAL